jgi:hypothetical protein
MKAAVRGWPLLATALLVASCNGTTGDALVAFPAYAAGAKGAGEPFLVYGQTPPKGESEPPPDQRYSVQLTFAQMYVGAIYINEAPAGSGGTFDTPTCIDPGVYCAQVPGGLEVNLLSTAPQRFAVQGNGSADQGLSWELYLVDGDVNSPDNSAFGTPNTVDLVGTATRESDQQVFSWAATVTINTSNRGEPAQEPGQPGLNPICKQRILELGGIRLTPAQGGSLLLTIDPRGWFKLPIDFSQLPSVASTQCQIDSSTMYGDAQVCIPDASNLAGGTPGSQDGANLFRGISTGGSAAYTLTFASP